MVQRTAGESSTADPRLPALAALRTRPPLRLLPGRNATKADVSQHRAGAVAIALKDYGRRPFLIRHTIGRLLVARESRALRALEGVHGVPAFLGRLGPDALATGWVEGATLAELAGRELDPSVFDRLDDVLARVHARGVALGDLHHRDVIVGPGGEVVVVDLATAWALGPRPGRLRRAIFRRLAELDRLAAARMRARFLRGDPDEAVRSIGGPAARWHRRGRRLKALWDRLRGAA